jgi:trk system potassium uptake protein TrkH
MGYFASPTLDLIAVFFMFVSGVNFALHFMVWEQKRVSAYLLDTEFRAYVRILGVVTLTALLYLYATDYYGTLTELFTRGLFQVVSIGTTTGFTTDDFAAWPGALPVLLLLSSFIGGCAGSTAGGMKVIRWLLMYKQGMREVLRLVHPNAEIPVKLGPKAVSNRVIDAVWGFFAIYIVVYGALMMSMMAFGLDQVTAFAAVAATLNNLGPGLGDVATGFGSMTPAVKWLSVCAMLLGRLEIFTLLVLFTPAFWRR